MAFKILVVDDSITIQKIVAMAFENEDAVVEGIGNGSEALVKLKEYRPDIVLADVDMPGLNGFDLSKKIKNSKEFASVSVLLLTSDFEDFNEEHVRESLADDQITKPFKSEDIVFRVMELLKQEKSSTSQEDDEAENVIALSQTDRVEEESVVDLGEDQLLNSLEEFPPENEKALDEESFINLEKEQPMNPQEIFPPQEEVHEESPNEKSVADLEGESSPDSQEIFAASNEEFHLELSDEDMLIVPENSEQDDLVLELEEEEITAENGSDDPPEVAIETEPISESKPEPEKVPMETMEELIRRVEELSNKSKEFHEQESSEEMLPLNTVDEVIKDVNALKSVPPSADQGDNGQGQPSFDNDREDTLVAEDNGTAPSAPESGREAAPVARDNAIAPSTPDANNGSTQVSQDNGMGKPAPASANGSSLVAEVSYISEENADELEAAFQEILNSNKGHSSNLATVQPEESQNDGENEVFVPEPEAVPENFTVAPVKESFENFEPEDEAKPASVEESQLSEESTMAPEENFENISEFQSSQEELFYQLMGKEVKEVLEQSLNSSMEKEISGLSDKIMKSVEKIVREIVPDLAKTIIDQEVEKIKNRENR